MIYTNNVDRLPTGLASEDAIEKYFSTRYVKGVEEGRVTVLEGGANVRSGKGLQILYPKGGDQSSRSGATWEVDLQHSAEELYLSYWVKFEEQFQWVKGGKLPGLAGMTSFPDGTNEFTARLMWREEGKIEFYLHGFHVNNSQGEEPYRVFWDDFGGHAQFTAGRWHHVKIHVKLNTPGKRDGLLEGWLDGKLRCRDTDNSGVRATGEQTTKINYLYFSTFFGGSSAPESQWQPDRDMHAYFDDFVVARP